MKYDCNKMLNYFVGGNMRVEKKEMHSLCLCVLALCFNALFM